MQVEILVPLGFFAVIFASLYVYLTTRNKERLAMIEKGVSPEIFFAKQEPKSGYSNFKFGLFLIGVAIGIIAGYFLMEAGMDDSAAYFSMIFLFGGIGLVASFLLQKRFEDK